MSFHRVLCSAINKCTSFDLSFKEDTGPNGFSPSFIRISTVFPSEPMNTRRYVSYLEIGQLSRLMSVSTPASEFE